MTKTRQLVFQALKEELEQQKEDYSKWIMAVSIKKEVTVFDTHNIPTFTARVVVKTNESPYVDGTDIEGIIVFKEVVIHFESLEDGPIFHGGTVEYALEWVRVLEEPFYIQLDNPFQGQMYQLRRLKLV